MSEALLQLKSEAEELDGIISEIRNQHLLTMAYGRIPMKRLLVTALAAAIATFGVAISEVDARGGRTHNDRGGENAETRDGYWRYGYRGHRSWRRHYWRGDQVNVSGNRNGCYRLKVNRWGEVRYKLRRACRW